MYDVEKLAVAQRPHTIEALTSHVTKYLAAACVKYPKDSPNRMEALVIAANMVNIERGARKITAVQHLELIDVLIQMEKQ